MHSQALKSSQTKLLPTCHVLIAYQIVVPDFGRIEGPFQITSLEYRGDHAGEVTFEMAFESAGALTFVAL